MYLGIDLGTSNSAIVGHNGSALRLFKTADGADVLPSAIYEDAKGRRFVGRRAYEQAAVNPDTVAREFKRLMGTSSPISLGNHKITPEEASSEILRALLLQAKTEAGESAIDGTVITIPAAFNQMQTEATILAADLAGISPVGLIHEPIAAAMASMANSNVKTGQFIVYDLGGGTFDVALVQSSSGVVNVVAHEGVNMLGGKDFDQLLIVEIVSPWLETQFDLPKDYRLHPTFAPILKRAKLKIEQAKIELSSRESTSVFLGDDEIRARDLNGKEIYLDVEITRKQLEEVVGPKIERTVEVCQKVIATNGFSARDLDRIVLIGGPSKMPLVRQSVPAALGIPADLATDPMTAVATGAAIYAESRAWSAGSTSRKPSRASQVVRGELEVKYDYPARVAENRAVLRMSAQGQATSGWRIRIDGADGWSSGLIDVQTSMKIELPLSQPGQNRFWATLSGPQNQTQKTEFEITQTFASSAGVPATLTICVAVEQDVGGSRREVLHPLVKKGTLLPCSGSEPFRAARSLVGGTDDYIDVRVYQAPDDVTDPGLTLLVGSFRLDAKTRLEPGATLRQGQKLDIHWTMDDSGLLDARIEIPQLSLTYEMGTFFSPKIGHKDFSGTDGKDLADGLVTDAEKAVEEVGKALGDTAWAEIAKLRRRVETQKAAIDQSSDADTRRQAAEESLSVRQEVARLRCAPANQNAVISRELAKVEDMYDEVSDSIDDAAVKSRVQQLSSTARRLLDGRENLQAEACVNQMRSIVIGEMLRQPRFMVMHFEILSEERFVAIDKTLHDKLSKLGRECIHKEEWDALGRVNSALLDNRFSTAPVEPLASRLVGLVRG